MAYTQQLINKEDHLLACTTRMFEIQTLLPVPAIVNSCEPSITGCFLRLLPNGSKRLGYQSHHNISIATAHNALAHILAVSDYSLVKEQIC